MAKRTQKIRCSDVSSTSRVLHAESNRGRYFSQPRFLKYHIGTTALAIINTSA